MEVGRAGGRAPNGVHSRTFGEPPALMMAIRRARLRRPNGRRPNPRADPIENALAKLKAFVQAAECAVEGLRTLMGSLSERCTWRNAQMARPPQDMGRTRAPSSDVESGDVFRGPADFTFGCIRLNRKWSGAPSLRVESDDAFRGPADFTAACIHLNRKRFIPVPGVPNRCGALARPVSAAGDRVGSPGSGMRLKVLRDTLSKRPEFHIA